MIPHRREILVFDRRHVEQAVGLHTKAFPGFFLSFLGPRFLAEFYRSFVYDRQAVALVAVVDARVCGVVVGTSEPVGFFGRMLKRRWWAFALASVPPLLARPSVGVRLLRALRYRGDAPPVGRRALLSSIAVDPGLQGSGVGRDLIAAWLAQAKTHKVEGAYLMTDADNNDAVNSFYRLCGWRADHEFYTRENRRMNRYIIDFK